MRVIRTTENSRKNRKSENGYNRKTVEKYLNLIELRITQVKEQANALKKNHVILNFHVLAFKTSDYS